MGVTQGLAEFVATTTFEQMPDEVVETSKNMMLNGAAVGLAGSRTPEGDVVARYAEQMGGTPVSTLLGKGLRTSPVNAALANGTMVHVLDYDEHVQRRANHPTNVMLPTVMALGEERSLPGRSVLEAFAIGCEVSTKLGAAGDFDAVRPRMWHDGWQLDGVTGVVGAAAAAGKLLRLDPGQLQHAVAIAVSQSAGTQIGYGNSCKSFHCGKAAMNGIMAAVLAADGFTGAPDAVEHEKGYFGTYRRSTDVDAEDLLHRLGNPYDVVDPGVGLKLHPCASLTAASVDALIRLMADHDLGADDVVEIHASCPPDEAAATAAFADPVSGLQAKFSIRYCLAVTLLHGRPRIHHFADDAVADERTRQVLERVTVEGSEVVTPEVSRPATVSLTLADGRRLRHRIDFPDGHPAKPLDADQLSDKFRYCADGVLAEDVATKAIGEFRRMESLADVAPLFASLGGSR